MLKPTPNINTMTPITMNLAANITPSSLLKSLLVVISLLTSFSLAAEPKTINIDLVDAPIADAAELAIKGLIGKNYIIEPDLKNASKKVTMKLADVTPDKALDTIQNLLAEQGVALQLRDDVVYVKSASSVLPNQTAVSNPFDTNFTRLQSENSPLIVQTENEQAYMTYQAKHRDVDYSQKLLELLSLRSVADNDNLFIFGDYSKVKIARSLLMQYDRPLKDIQIRASVVEFNNTDNVGFNFAAFLTSKRINLSVGSNSLLRDSLRVTGTAFSVILGHIQEDSRFNVLNTSTMRVSSGKTARINVGNDVPVLANTTFNQNGNPTQNIEYRNSGLILDVTPKITNRNITADLLQQVSSFNQTTTSTINSPTLSKRELKTTFNAQLNEVIILGGLDSIQHTNIANSLFGIPIGKTDTINKTSLYIIIEFTGV